jgi:hypothetical protein
MRVVANSKSVLDNLGGRQMQVDFLSELDDYLIATMQSNLITFMFEGLKNSSYEFGYFGTYGRNYAVSDDMVVVSTLLGWRTMPVSSADCGLMLSGSQTEYECDYIALKIQLPYRFGRSCCDLALLSWLTVLFGLFSD